MLNAGPANVGAKATIKVTKSKSVLIFLHSPSLRVLDCDQSAAAVEKAMWASTNEQWEPNRRFVEAQIWGTEVHFMYFSSSGVSFDIVASASSAATSAASAALGVSVKFNRDSADDYHKTFDVPSYLGLYRAIVCKTDEKEKWYALHHPKHPKHVDIVTSYHGKVDAGGSGGFTARFGTEE